ncbi:MAG: hypothetical protein C0394_09835 [Syntrophus sp. (in: bacteria)]|nr:hypothetical protein [Syntrophus sp. (in: bacteria)]
MTDKRRANERGEDRRSEQSAGEGRPEQPEGGGGRRDPERRERAVVEAASEREGSQGRGQGKGRFFTGTGIDRYSSKEFKACDGKKYAFPVGCKAKPKAMPELRITLDGRNRQPALQWKELARGGTL